MATSGALSTSNQYVKYTITITQNSQNIANNTSNVTVSVRFYRTNTGYVTYGTGTLYCKINGTTYSASVTPSQEITNSGIVLFTKTLDIGHNSDGTKTLTCSAWISHNAPLSSSEQSYSQVLTTIPRKSTMNVANGVLGTAMTLKVTRQSSSFTHTITYECGSYTGTICEKSSSTSISWTPHEKFANGAPNGSSVYLSFSIETFNGNTSLGKNGYSVWCTIPESDTYKPSVSISVSDAMGYLSTYGNYVKSKSKFKIEISASGKYSATIKSYGVTVDGKKYTTSSFTTDVISGSGTLTISAEVTDSRGRKGTTSINVTVLDYKLPKISSVSVYRCDSSGNPLSSGGYLAVSFRSTIISLNNKNTARYVIGYKKVMDTEYTNETLSTYENVYSVTDGKFVFVADRASSYDITLTAKDAFGSVSKTTVGTSIKKLFSWGTTIFGIAFGKIVELVDTLDVGLKTLFRYDVTVQNDKRIYFENSNGELRNTLSLNSDNNLTLGYGGYTASEGKTFIFGNAVSFKSNSSFSFDNNITIPNAKSIYMANTDGTAKNVLILNSENKVNIGYGLYADSVGSTNIYGNDVGLKYKGSLYINNSKLSDFVVASGVSGSWYYRKWNSGFAECWENYVFTPSSWTTNGNMYWARVEGIQLPFTFKTLVTVNATVSYAPFAEVASGYKQYGSDITSISAVVMQFYNSSKSTMQLGFYCYGLWK